MKISKLTWLGGLMALAAVIGAVAYSPKTADAAVQNAQKICEATGTVNVARCVLTFQVTGVTNAGNAVVNIDTTGPATFRATEGATITAGAGCVAVETAGAVAGATTFQVRVTRNVGGGGVTCTVRVVEFLNITAAGTVGNVLRQVGVAGQVDVFAVGIPAFVPPTPGAAAITQIIPDGCEVISGQSTGIVAGTITGSSVNVAPGGSVRLACTLDLRDNDAAPDTVSSGVINITVGQPTTDVVFTINGVGNVSGASILVANGETANVACGRGAGGAANAEGCDEVVVIITVAAGVNAPRVIPVLITAQYTPDLPLRNTPAALPATQVFQINTTPIGPATGPVPTAVTKNCTTATVAGQGAGTAVVGQPITCVVTVAFPAGTAIAATPAVVTVAGSTIGVTGVATTATFNLPQLAAATPGPTTTFTEVIIPTTAGVIPTQTIVINGTTFNPGLTGIVTVIAAGPAVTQIIPDGCEVLSSSTGLVNTTTGVDATSANVTVGGTVRVRCILDIDDNQLGTAGDVVSSGTVSVTVGSPAGGVVASVLGITDNNGLSGTVAGTAGQTANITCGRTTAGATTVDGCDFVVVEFSVAANVTAPFSRAIQITAQYTPDFPNVNTPAALAATTVFTVNTVVNIGVLAGPANLAIECFNNFSGATSGTALTTGVGSVVTGAVGTLSPGQLGGAGVLATGVLPGAVGCQVVNRVGGVLVPFAPGTIEVSSLNGTLIDLSGRLTTNLRIPCGQAVVVDVTSGTALNPNTCTGVSFGVLGLGVGEVELRARYEPTPGSTGIAEREVGGSVRFVAPQVGVTLTLNPNPVAVGATGTATASFFQAFAASCGSTVNTVSLPGASATAGGVTVTVPGATSTTTTTVPCIDPATGTAITTSAGSVLNGVVVFTIEDSAIARFVTSLTGPGATISGTTAGTTLNIGVTNTANQVVVSCGAFSGGGTPFINIGGASGPLSPFFGGCSSASAFYRGLNAGATNIAASFIPFLPGAASAVSTISGATLSTAFGAGIAGINFFGTQPATTSRVLQVADVAPTGNIQLAAGCNNVSPTVTESISAFLARVTPAAVVRGVFEYQTATSRFTAAPGAAAPAGASAAADLTGVTRLRPVFICVNAAATLDQPAA